MSAPEPESPRGEFHLFQMIDDTVVSVSAFVCDSFLLTLRITFAPGIAVTRIREGSGRYAYAFLAFSAFLAAAIMAIPVSFMKPMILSHKWVPDWSAFEQLLDTKAVLTHALAPAVIVWIASRSQRLPNRETPLAVGAALVVSSTVVTIGMLISPELALFSPVMVFLLAIFIAVRFLRRCTTNATKIVPTLLIAGRISVTVLCIMLSFGMTLQPLYQAQLSAQTSFHDVSAEKHVNGIILSTNYDPVKSALHVTMLMTNHESYAVAISQKTDLTLYLQTMDKPIDPQNDVLLSSIKGLPLAWQDQAAPVLVLDSQETQWATFVYPCSPDAFQKLASTEISTYAISIEYHENRLSRERTGSARLNHSNVVQEVPRQQIGAVKNWQTTP